MMGPGQDKQPAAEKGVIIRPGVKQDAAAIHAMVRALAVEIGEGHKVTSQPADFERLGFGVQPAFESLVAERDRQPVGLCLYFYSFSSWRGMPGIYLQDIYVAASERGTGLGRKLIAETAQRAALNGAEFLRLSVDETNREAIDFYQALGLRYMANENIFMATGDDFHALEEICGDDR